MVDAINLVGAICSILGAVYAFKQAGVAKSAAQISESIKRQLINHRKTSDLAELQAMLKAAQNVFNKYGASSPSQLRGSDQNSDAQVVLNFINRLKELRGYFEDHFDNAADLAYDDINMALVEFKATTSPKKVSKLGTEILNLVTGFSPSLEKRLNDHKEKTE